MQSRNHELWAAFFAILLITLVYAYMFIRLDGVPPARELYGHMMGVVGFILMLMSHFGLKNNHKAMCLRQLLHSLIQSLRFLCHTSGVNSEY